MMVFTEDNHKYANMDTLEVYGGMTSLISSFVQKKDWNKIAENYLKKFNTKEKLFKDLAKKAGITFKQAEIKWGSTYEHSVSWIRNVWKSKSEDSLEGGSYFHAFKELQDSKLENVVYNPVKDNKKYSTNLEDLKLGYTYLELMLFLHKYKLCGQADKVIITNNSKSIVRDFKTNEKPITSEVKAYFNKKLKRKVIEKFISPISHIPVTDYYKYALQLSGYGYILECYGYPPEALIIDQVITKTIPSSKVKATDLVLFEDKLLSLSRVFVKMAKPLEVPYLKKEVISIFEYYKLNNFKYA